MTRRIPDCRLRWIRHCHFASACNSFSGERRLVRLKQDDPAKPVAPIVGSMNMQDAVSDLTPEERALGITKENAGTAIAVNELLHNAQEAKEERTLDAHFGDKKIRDQILLTLKGMEGIWQLKKMLDGEISSSPEDIYRKIETMTRRDEKPEDDAALRRVMEQTRREVAELPEGKQQSHWALFLSTVREFGKPVYTRLANFLTHPLIQAHHALSVERCFEEFRDPGKRLALMKELSDPTVRTSLVRERSHPLAERRRALDDLFSFLTHAYPLLSGEERAAFYDTYCRVSACIAVLEDEAVREAQGKEARSDEATPEHYRKKQERLGTFLREDSGIRKENADADWIGSASGRESLTSRLKKEEDDVVFAYLRRGLETGGWISELHLSRGEEYLCTRITLEETYLLYDEIASSRAAPQEPESLLHHVRSTFLDVIRRKSQGISLRQRTANTGIEGSNPLQEAQLLERRIQEKIAREEKPLSSEVNEFLLLVSWVEGSGVPYALPKNERRSLQLLAERSIEELEREAELRREDLAPLAESATIRWGVRDHAEENLSRHAARPSKLQRERSGEQSGPSTSSGQAVSKHIAERLTTTQNPLEEKTLVSQILATGDPPALISALCAIQEEKRLFLEPRRRERHPAWEASILHEAAENAYVAKLIAIREKYGYTKIAERLKDTLNREYDEGNAGRQELFTSELYRWETLALRALEAEIRLQARKLRGKYVQRLEVLQAKERFPRVKGYDSYALFVEHEDMLHALHALETITLGQDAFPSLSAEAALGQLSELAKDIADPLAAVKRRKEELDRVRVNARALRKAVQGKVSPETDAMLREYENTPSVENVAAVKGMDLFSKHPGLLPFAERGYKEMEQHRYTIKNALREIQTLQEKKKKAFENLRRILQKYPDECGFAVQIEREEAEVAGLLSIAKAESKETPWKLAEAAWIIARIEQATGTLKRITEKEPDILSGDRFATLALKHRFSPGARAAFIPEPHGSERIVLNAERVRNPEMQRLVVLAERAHALHHILSEFYPTFFAELHDDLAKNLPSDLQGTFETLTKKWAAKTEDMTDLEWKTEVADECMEKRLMYRTFRATGSALSREDLPLSPEEFAFFETLDKRGINPLLLHAGHLSMRPKHRKLARMSNGDDDMGFPDFAPSALNVGADQGPTGIREVSGGRGGRGRGETAHGESGEGGNGDYVETSKIPEDFDTARKALIKIKAFLESNPDHGPDSADNRAYVKELEQEYEKLSEEFQEKPHAEADEDFQRRVKQVADDLGKVADFINEEDQRREDLRKVPPETRGLRALWQDVRWLSVHDVVRIFKDIGEDIKRQHNRRQEGKIGQIGETITSWIPQWVPYLGNLHHDFHERQQKAELDEVEHFKKGLANIDAYEIQFMTHHTRNKDHLKACVQELVERGRMNWNDTEMWETFNALSRFRMPIKDCQRNENLREAWLRKVISDIWSEKDNYRNWKRKNDETFASKMKEYTPEVDRLSNLKGGLEGELEKQLRTFVELKKYMKDTGKHVPLDETLRRDLYMEVIDYSIRNGKMSMEQKFYYLVQGIAEGLISADRLRILAGEGGGVLNLFPFIDYFYKRNNTMPEIQALAKRLLETDETNHKNPDRFKPGLKTTMWLELEVAREESVQQRLRKGAYRKGGEQDHDDMHFFMPRLDYKTLDSMATPQGGGRQQVTADGWMNAYSGYNAFFKSLGILSKLEEDKLGMRFTTQDSEQIIRAVAGFVRMDGILTKRSGFDGAKDRRPGIPWSQLRTTYSVVSSKEDTVYGERKRVDAFIKALLRAYDFTEQEIADGLFSTEENPNPTEAQEKKAHNFSAMLDTEFAKRVKRDGIGKMKQVLKQFMPTFTSQGEYKYDYEKIKAIKRKELEQKKAKLAPAPAASTGH